MFKGLLYPVLLCLLSRAGAKVSFVQNWVCCLSARELMMLDFAWHSHTLYCCSVLMCPSESKRTVKAGTIGVA